jgi:inner membrane protein
VLGAAVVPERDRFRCHLKRTLSSVASIPAWRYFARNVEQPTDRPFLNRRAEGYVGREFTLEKPIVGGVGTIHIDDTVWRVSGPDCPAGSRVKIARADGANLLVEAAA